MPDFLTPDERSARMSSIRGKNTGPERAVFHALRRSRVHFSRHAGDLPGRPDIVFRRLRLAVFIDGDFWHGRDFTEWARGLKPIWREKIVGNMRRDRRTRGRLRAMGWRVIRVWAREVSRDANRCVRRILRARERVLTSREMAASNAKRLSSRRTAERRRTSPDACR